MKLLKAIVFIALAIVALVVGILFSNRNATPVEVDLLAMQFAPMSVAVWILLSFTIGMVLSALFFGMLGKRYKHRYQKLLRSITPPTSSSSEIK